MQLLEFELNDGGIVVVEVGEDEPGIERAARVDEVVAKAGVNLERTLDQVRTVADVALVRLRNLAPGRRLGGAPRPRRHE